MAGNSPWQVGPGDVDGVVIPSDVPVGFFGTTPASQQTITLTSLPSNLPLTTANVQGLTATITQLSNILKAYGLAVDG